MNIPYEAICRERVTARHIVTHSNDYRESLVTLAWYFLVTWGAKT
tara:strand:+ start:514 stop:648 length:135 start_codon:yes stop_codon:yes gene_type:complete